METLADETRIPMRPDNLKSVAGIVVHHNRLDVLGSTVAGLIEEGIAPDNLIVVDNSDGDIPPEIHDSVEGGVCVEHIPNRGYGNAVNYGLDLVFSRSAKPEFVVVVTHEVSLVRGALTSLVTALRSHPKLAAVGPVLQSSQKEGPTWTASGGKRSRVFGIPVHKKGLQSGVQPLVERAWLDGAVVLYRASAIENRRIREDFFLYFEETEFHLRLAKEVGAVACATTAMAYEEANEVPPRLLGRNLQWFLDLHGNCAQRLISMPYVILRNIGKALLGRQSWSAVREIYRGWNEARSNPVLQDSDQWQ